VVDFQTTLTWKTNSSWGKENTYQIVETWWVHVKWIEVKQGHLLMRQQKRCLTVSIRL